MKRRKGTEPEQYAGPFQSYAEIPPRYRLENYAGQYQDEDTWTHYCEESLFREYDSNHMRKVARKAENSWLDHMEQRGCHHALATPEAANDWCKVLLNGNRVRRTCYEQFYVRIYQFYDWLREDSRHPHLYNPLLLSAINYKAARHLWMYRIDSRPEEVTRE
jgi:hypothetical protein